MAGDARRLARRRTTVRSCSVAVVDERISGTISASRANRVWHSQIQRAAEWSPVGWHVDFTLLNALAPRNERTGAPNRIARAREAAVNDEKFFALDKNFGKNMLH